MVLEPNWLPPEEVGIPEELKSIPQWVCWRAVLRGEGEKARWTKPPVNPHSNENAKANDPATWAPFATAWKHYKANRWAGMRGVGFVLTPETPFAGIDLDHCLRGDGTLAPWARRIVEDMASYAEVSPSRQGLRIFVRGKLPPGGRKKAVGEGGMLEMYDSGRYLTVTGAVLGGRSAIKERQAELESLHARIFPPAKEMVAPHERPLPLSDEEILERACRAKDGDLFARLMAGDISDYGGDHSAADMALCFRLAFWLGGDPARMDRVFRSSGLYRAKWDARHHADGRTYGQGTIDKAVADNRERYDPWRQSDVSDKADVSGRTGQGRSASDRTGQCRSASGKTAFSRPERFEGNLTGELREWVATQRGSFTSSEVDREFNLVLRQDKKRRSDALYTLIKEGRIVRDRRVAGKYHILRAEVDWVDLETAEGGDFPLNLPLGLSDLAALPPKAVILVAGATNAGKTAFLLNLLRDNLNTEQGLVYLMSEMGVAEYKQRVSPLCPSLKQWSHRVRAAECSEGFDGLVKAHNPDGITVVDFLEEIEGEYFRNASEIRRIYDALGSGVAVIAMQKKSGALYARGGESTAEKARLYLAMDCLLHRPGATIGAVRIVKCKAPRHPERNPNGLERHFRIEQGHRLVPVSEWMYCSEQRRERLIKTYQAGGNGTIAALPR
ncbi:MAG: hypothetical protein ACNI3A_11340 [Desulfovibrio sp.]|uniref:phage NrS-1 polymerase family protein n=1 Tax=Desulfovibrio sp. 7SRBS1 TaxID=3378064 RepID=UPI003B3F3BD4